MYAMNIRKAKTADLEILTGFGPVTDRRQEDIKSAIIQGRCWVYADSGQDPVAYAILQSDFYDYPFVKLLYVAETSRRQGVASRLMRHLETVCGADRVFTSANQSNAFMRGMMDKLSYSQCGEINGLDDNDPELVFMKRLTS